ncbi:hypothetical protein [Thermosipho atlanticus]|uniref:hypothetical protein n=1 Tax=Thermosipho atlanticus TaxID=238991 RepID=UPI000934648D|nr:hypothetical protein [Thermosipho atlanticus]
MGKKDEFLFISDNPTTEDHFKIHEEIAEKIANFVQNIESGTTIALKGNGVVENLVLLKWLKKEAMKEIIIIKYLYLMYGQNLDINSDRLFS